MFGLMSRVAIAGTAIYGGKELLMNSVKQMADFEDRLNRVRKVLQPTQADIKALGAAAIRMGQEFGTSISTIAGTMELVAQQGKKQADIISITRTATMAANVTNLDAAEAIDTITAAMKAFQMQGTQSMRVLDSWNELENTTGVSAKTLAEATKYAGAAARNAGVDFDQFNGIVATIAETTRQSGEQVGTVIRMMLEGYKDDRGIEALQNVGVLVADNTGKYKSFSSVLDQLTKVWPRLSEAQKQNVGVSLAGTRNLNAFFALMDNLPKLQENVAKSMNSGGSAARENEKAVESLNRKIESLKAAYDGLWQSIGNSGVLTALKVVTQTLKQMVDLIGTVNTGSGGLLGAAAAIGIPMLAVRGMGMAGGSGIMEERRVEMLEARPPLRPKKPPPRLPPPSHPIRPPVCPTP
jgi:TP901 family phage tail tape measure protein